MPNVNLRCFCGNDKQFALVNSKRFCLVCGLNQIEVEKHPPSDKKRGEKKKVLKQKK